MPTRKNRNPNTKNSDADNENIVPLNVEVERFDQRIKNVEKIVEMIRGISDKAFELGTDYLVKKTESEQRQQELDDNQHKRSIYLLTFAISVIFVLCLAALFQNQFELVKFFINSGLAIAAGTGIASLLRARPKQKKKIEEE